MDLLRKPAARHPDGIGLDALADTRMTHQEWDRRVDRVANGLLARGLAAGDTVAVLFAEVPSAQFAVAYFGVLRAGGVALHVCPEPGEEAVSSQLSGSAAVGVLHGTGLRPPPCGLWQGTLDDIDDGDDSPVDVGLAPEALADHVRRSQTTAAAKALAVRGADDHRPVRAAGRRGIDPLAVEAEGLAKSFGGVPAVAGVDLAVPTGSIYGVLGPNGAGKTTTIKMLATLLRPDAGSARVCGHDIVRESGSVRAAVTLTGQLASVDEDLTGWENLVLLGRLLGLRRRAGARADKLLDAFGLTAAGGRLVKQYSGGMRRRLDIAVSIVVTPQLLLLDEPTTGLDPRSRAELWEIVRALAGGGTTVLLSTQYLEEADQLADRIAVIDHGRVIAEGTPAELKSSLGTGVLQLRVADPAQRERAEHVLARVVGPATRSSDATGLSASCSEASLAAAALVQLTREGVGIANFSLGQPSLEEVFLTLTGDQATSDPPDPRKPERAVEERP
jgi:ABC-2 type transport system ATP-binding protein